MEDRKKDEGNGECKIECKIARLKIDFFLKDMENKDFH